MAKQVSISTLEPVPQLYTPKLLKVEVTVLESISALNSAWIREHKETSEPVGIRDVTCKLLEVLGVVGQPQ